MSRYVVAVRYPSGETEFRYTSRLPEAGELIGNNGNAGIVADVKLDGNEASVTVRVAKSSPKPVSTTLHANSRRSSSARERILDAAYDLFSRRGVRDVGIDEVIERAEVAKATLYRHFRSKEELVLAFLERREQRWTRDWVEFGARRRGSTAEESLLAIFDVFDGWFRRDDFEGCSFINILLEISDDADPINRASVGYLENIRGRVRVLAEEAGLRDPETFAHSWHLLMKGSIVAAGEGDTEAAQRAKTLGRLLLDLHRPQPGNAAAA
jgi:AcrR family transcriptional regulator